MRETGPAGLHAVINRITYEPGKREHIRYSDLFQYLVLLLRKTKRSTDRAFVRAPANTAFT